MNKSMTIRQEKKSRKLSTKPGPDILSDDRTKFIIENMTARHAQILQDFKKDRRHPPTCVCWLCIWRTFEKMRPVGPPYDYLTFLAYDVIEEVIGPFQYEPVKKTPIKKLAREVIRRLPIISVETKKVLNDFARERFRVHFIEYSRKGRYQSDKLQNLVERIMYQIHREAGRKPPDPGSSKPLINLNRRPPTRVPLPLKIAKFVYSQPDHKATQRQLQRYTNKRRSELEDLHEWLKWRYGIIIPPHEKWESTIYKGTCPTLPKSPGGKRILLRNKNQHLGSASLDF